MMLVSAIRWIKPALKPVFCQPATLLSAPWAEGVNGARVSFQGRRVESRSGLHDRVCMRAVVLISKPLCCKGGHPAGAIC